MKFGEKVRDLRKKHSLTQDELAQCLGINKRTIIGWERDGRYPRSIEMLEKMADIFHVPDQVLFLSGMFPSGKRANYAVDLTQE